MIARGGEVGLGEWWSVVWVGREGGRMNDSPFLGGWLWVGFEVRGKEESVPRGKGSVETRGTRDEEREKEEEGSSR